MRLKDQPLRGTLAQLPTPPPSAVAQEQALAQALAAFRAAPRTSPPTVPSPQKSTARIWAFAIVSTAVVLIAMLITRQAEPPPQPPGYLLSEMQKLFPGQVVAIVEHNHAVDLQLGDIPAPVPTGQALHIELIRGTQQVDVLTYSGRNVNVELNGQSASFTPLITESGAFIMVTMNQVVSAGGNWDGYELHAQLLASN